LNSDRSSFISQQELVTDRKLALIRVMGMSDTEDFVVDNTFRLDSALILEELLQQAEASNPLLRSQLVNEEILKLQSEELSRSRAPQIDLNLSYDYSNLESEAGFLFRNQTTGFNYGLTARVNIFDGFNRQRELQNARVQIENGQVLYEEARTNVLTNLKSVFNTYSNNLRLSRIEAQNQEVAQENSRIALERFRLGVSDALELREAQTNAVNAEIRYLQARYATKQAEIELKRLTGSISQQD
jgi:outer membrane protein TolC